MLKAQQFKTLAGAQKRAAFENAHCKGRYLFQPVRCVNGEPDSFPITAHIQYTWRLRRTIRMPNPFMAV
jgi:hypothetical protein